MNTPIDVKLVNAQIEKLGVKDLGRATIRELVSLVNWIQKESGKDFVRMEMGEPGLNPPSIGIEAEIEALRSGVAAKYPMVDGITELKNEASRFIKNFMNIDVSPSSCIPTVGSMQGGYAIFLLCANLDPKKDTALFIDPGFPVQKQQYKVMGHKFESFDVFEYRGEKLREKLESFLSKGNINSIIYSNPNNPSWICFTEDELKIIGELASKYDVIVIEDLAYIAMDFRKDLYHPGKPPYQVSVANYTDNYVLLISGSKAFSYAGQRIAVTAISDKIYNRKYPNLIERFGTESFGYTFVLRIIYALSSGTSHSAQYALAAMLKAANDGKFNFVDIVKEYGVRAEKMKKLFLDAGFKIVYDKDLDEDIADGFYFTISYPGLTGGELVQELLYYGISAISLLNTGSKRGEGLRACVSQVVPDKMKLLEERLEAWKLNHK
ncbi:MAG: pyridoxal phosphate-dependent aminotransferase [Bacteroidales bacterium]|jgi:aspartate/methionine/tyrosine aminotransferase|nr:pyridoxal phosphate-dependent aminotransferase [Bacteroidales bacterium]MDY0314426.1 pyridoxal phosphate-dependent aminotransferase [Bacteroidales bacterium]NLB87174.1 pyridoxal phosphate-dependent aminotransferase [Bacteroidales bacterium]